MQTVAEEILVKNSKYTWSWNDTALGGGGTETQDSSGHWFMVTCSLSGSHEPTGVAVKV